MRVFLILSVLCITLALCHAACSHVQNKLELRNGVWMAQESCTDLYDGSKHPPGSEWNTAHCLTCICYGRGGMSCCTRYGPVGAPGCKAVFNPETCQHELYRIDSPSEPC